MCGSTLIECESIIGQRIKEFETLGNKGRTLFDFSPFMELEVEATVRSELAFCISTANSSAAAGLKFQKSLEGRELDTMTADQFQRLLKDSGVRFHNRKAGYIREAMDSFPSIYEALEGEAPRNFLVKNVKGLGLKEASHFLRNMGFRDVAIVDRHIIKCLIEEDHLENSNINSRKYVECEAALKSMADQRSVCMAELDLQLWYDKTGKILK
ncbi:MAG: N-glycosylase/DNA lyase [Archaeoglobaceae archaeon]